MNISPQGFTQTPAIFKLIEAGDIDAVKRHLQKYPQELHLKGRIDKTPLHIAAGCNNLEMVRLLVEKGADVNAKSTDHYWTYPLNLVKSVAVATYLLDHGARLDSQVLRCATVHDAVDVIALFLERGADWDQKYPCYMDCRSSAAMQVYLDHGISLDGNNNFGQNLLHRLAGDEDIEKFNQALAAGVPWKKDNYGVTPYYFAKNNGRRTMVTYLRDHHPELVAHFLRDLDPSEVQFGLVKCMVSSPSETNVVYVWTSNAQLGRIEIDEGKSIVVRAVSVNVCQVSGFCIDRNGDILMPTADSELLILDPVTLQLKISRSLAMGLDIQTIFFLEERELYLVLTSDDAFLLDSEFEVVEHLKLFDLTLEMHANESGSLIAFLYFDQDPNRNLQHLNDRLELTQYCKLDLTKRGESKSVRFNGDMAMVNYPKHVVCYEFTQGKIIEQWELDLSITNGYIGEHVSSLFVDENRSIIGFGQQLLHIESSSGAIIGVTQLDMETDILDMQCTSDRKFLIVIGKGVTTLKIDEIPWTHHQKN